MWSNNNVVLVLATLALCLVALAPKPTEGLSCMPCPKKISDRLKLCGRMPTNCKNGIVRSPCGCCLVCGKGPGEPCWQFSVQCGTNLECRYNRTDPTVSFMGVCKNKRDP